MTKIVILSVARRISKKRFFAKLRMTELCVQNDEINNLQICALKQQKMAPVKEVSYGHQGNPQPGVGSR